MRVFAAMVFVTGLTSCSAQNRDNTSNSTLVDASEASAAHGLVRDIDDSSNQKMNLSDSSELWNACVMGYPREQAKVSDVFEIARSRGFELRAEETTNGLIIRMHKNDSLTRQDKEISVEMENSSPFTHGERCGPRMVTTTRAMDDGAVFSVDAAQNLVMNMFMQSRRYRDVKESRARLPDEEASDRAVMNALEAAGEAPPDTAVQKETDNAAN
jgi:hypothetical protein